MEVASDCERQRLSSDRFNSVLLIGLSVIDSIAYINFIYILFPVRVLACFNNKIQLHYKSFLYKHLHFNNVQSGNVLILIYKGRSLIN